MCRMCSRLRARLAPNNSAVILRCERSEPRRIDMDPPASILRGPPPDQVRDRAPQDDGSVPLFGRDGALRAALAITTLRGSMRSISHPARTPPVLKPMKWQAVAPLTK